MHLKIINYFVKCCHNNQGHCKLMQKRKCINTEKKPHEHTFVLQEL